MSRPRAAFIGRPEREISTFIDVGDHAERKLRGIRCHVTQIGRHNPYADTPDQVMQEPWFCRETFVLAASTVGRPEGIETDLFSGLRS